MNFFVVISIVLIIIILAYILYEIFKTNLCYKRQVSFHDFSEITIYEKEEPPNSKKVKLIIKTKV
jgi:hypothetical protein